MKLTLVHCKTDEEINIDAENPFIIGRGPLLNCNDKKVSRSHCLLQLTPDGQLHVAALHKNPCFIMRNGSPLVLQLLKDEEEILNNGDYLGLLHDSFWYRVVISNAEEERNDIDDSFLKKADSDSEITNMTFFRKGSIIKSSGEIDQGSGRECEYQTLGNESKSVQDKSQVQLKKVDESKVTKDELKESNVVKEKFQDKSVEGSSFGKLSQGLLCGKEEEVVKKPDSKDSNHVPSLDEKLQELEKTKKLPLSMYQIDDFLVFHKLSSSVKSSSSSITDNTARDGSSWSSQRQASASGSGQLQPDTRTSNKDSVLGKENVDSPSTSTEVGTSFNIKTEDVEVKEEDKSSDTAAVSVEKICREICQYEHSCYRRNEEHRKQYAHPGDPDYVPYENRPMCQYGLACYRTNRKHRVEYRHPVGAGTNKKGKKPGGNTDSPERKRKKVEYYNDDEDEDDYDMDDPFLCDGTSDEYVPSDDSE